MLTVLEKLDQMSRKIKENIKSEANVDGLLIGEEEQYLECLKLGHRDFEELMQKDDAHWAWNIEDAKKEVEDLKQEFEKILKE